jgi:hypothetical protein
MSWARRPRAESGGEKGGGTDVVALRSNAPLHKDLPSNLQTVLSKPAPQIADVRVRLAPVREVVQVSLRSQRTVALQVAARPMQRSRYLSVAATPLALPDGVDLWDGCVQSAALPPAFSCARAARFYRVFGLNPVSEVRKPYAEDPFLIGRETSITY